MKKSLILLSIIASIATSKAYAKTEGNYVGFNILHSSQDFKLNTDKAKDSSVGFGLDYNHALNLNNFFAAPGVFAEKIGIKEKNGDAYSSLDYRYGAKLNIGYDIVDNFAVYLTNGLAVIHQKVYFEAEGRDPARKKYSTELDYFYGAGVSLKVNKDIAINLEYNTQKSDLKTPDKDTKLKTKLDVFKLGVSYNF